jgi:hypothetical protein
MLVFCIVHLKRNFAKKFGDHEIRHLILNKIYGAKTHEELAENMLSMCTLYPELKTWIINKQPRWLLCGLVKSESKIPIEYWTYARKHTGISESSHFSDNNFAGRKVSLLDAVLKYMLKTIMAYVEHILTIILDLSFMLLNSLQRKTLKTHKVLVLLGEMEAKLVDLQSFIVERVCKA